MSQFFRFQIILAIFSSDDGHSGTRQNSKLFAAHCGQMLCLTLKRKKNWNTINGGHTEYRYKTQLFYYILSTQVFSNLDIKENITVLQYFIGI